MHLSDEIFYNGPKSFSRRRLATELDLFDHRAALIYTKTSAVPPAFVGSGPLDVTLPIPTPSLWDLFERAHGGPRLWLDLLQRATEKIRWKPLEKPLVIFTRSDARMLPQLEGMAGIKAFLDALKLGTYGRRDGRWLSYFGAIVDDGPGQVDVEFHQATCASLKLATTRVQVVSGAGRSALSDDISRLTSFGPKAPST